MSIEFNCESCGKHYKVPDAMAGKRAKCKGCGQVIQVPSAVEDPSIEMASPVDETAPPPMAPPVPVPQRPTVAKSPVQSQQPAESLCPSCHEPLAHNAVLCIMCGFDLRKGVKIAGVIDKDDEPADDPASDSNSDSERDSSDDKGEKPWWRFW